MKSPLLRRLACCLLCLSTAAFLRAESAAKLNVIYDFGAVAGTGAIPASGLVQDSDGNFYGTNVDQGSGGYGTVFKLTPAGILTTLASFNNDNGAYPGTLVKGSDGNFYGATFAGGSGSAGTIFMLTPTGILTTLTSFNGIDGRNPRGLIQGSDGNLYGTTESGGSFDQGTVFKLSLTGELNTLASFNGANGKQPVGLVQSNDGNLYGTTYFGGSNDYGTIYQLTPSGTLTTLFSFDASNGSNPLAGLILGRDGNFYGTTSLGGSSSLGTAFKVTPQGALTTLVSFDGTNGANPYAGLVQVSDGEFCGTTTGGGSSGMGTVFRLTPEGVLTTLVSFNGANGNTCEGTLLQGSDGNLYGTTVAGGVTDAGIVFQIILPPPQVATPIISPDSGTYTTPQPVTISSVTSDAIIRFTTDGSLPSETNGMTYSHPFYIFSTTTVQAIAYKTGLTDSEITVATLTINKAPAITEQPLSQTVAKDCKVVFSVKASGMSPLSYQWKFNGKPIPCATAPTFTIYSAQPSNAGNYTVTVSNCFGKVTSDVATLTVNVPPSITQQPLSQTIKSGSKVTFCVAAAGTPPLSYQWKFNGTNINSATAVSFIINSVQPSDAGNYAVTVTHVAGSVTSSPVKLTVK